ncbi:unnamed protein product [Sphagnum troendelagicum]|uniref:Uncharacterized protein n=1 Tax=Sphagnum troendelagicum TaxID=128251 RepID=A0ABP0V2W9_9BRYO
MVHIMQMTWFNVPSTFIKTKNHLNCFWIETQSLRMVVKKQVGGMRRSTGVVCAFGDVSAEGTNYLIAGAVAIAIVGTALPIIFSRKDLCPECDGAGFVRKPGTKLNANAARKDLTQIVCKRCNGLGKIGFLQHNMFDLQPHSQWDITGLKNG